MPTYFVMDRDNYTEDDFAEEAIEIDASSPEEAIRVWLFQEDVFEDLADDAKAECLIAEGAVDATRDRYVVTQHVKVMYDIREKP